MKMISILTVVVVLTGCASVEEDVSFCYERDYDVTWLDDWTVACVTPYGTKTVGKLRFEEIEITTETVRGNTL